MTIAVDWDVKHQTKQKHCQYICLADLTEVHIESVVKCLTLDQRFAGLSLTTGTLLCPYLQLSTD